MARGSSGGAYTRAPKASIYARFNTCGHHRIVPLQIGGQTPYVSAMERLMETNFGFTERAAARIAEIVAAEGRPSALRVAVLAGGCSGFQYKSERDDAAQSDDVVIEHTGARVVVDPASLDLLAGAELDYTDELMGSPFAVGTPKPVSAFG